MEPSILALSVPAACPRASNGSGLPGGDDGKFDGGLPKSFARLDACSNCLSSCLLKTMSMDA